VLVGLGEAVGDSDTSVTPPVESVTTTDSSDTTGRRCGIPATGLAPCAASRAVISGATITSAMAWATGDVSVAAVGLTIGRGTAISGEPSAPTSRSDWLDGPTTSDDAEMTWRLIHAAANAAATTPATDKNVTVRVRSIGGLFLLLVLKVTLRNLERKTRSRRNRQILPRSGDRAAKAAQARHTDQCVLIRGAVANPLPRNLWVRLEQ
jgi:hypothetical protein